MKSQCTKKIEEILSDINPPDFPETEFNIINYGADKKGEKDSQQSINQAIAKCHNDGGGRVIVPAGEFISRGPIYLKSNVDLHLKKGSIIKFGVNPEDYLPAVLVRWEGTRCYNYSPLIYAYQEENIAVTGSGILDGQAEKFCSEWQPIQQPDKEILRDMGQKEVSLDKRIFGAGYHLRPDLFQTYECKNILLEGITVKGSPFWTIHPVFCDNVTIREVNFKPGVTNDDGCNPESSKNVLIEKCTFETEDDNIALKAGRDQDAWNDRPCENVVIRNCQFIRSGTNGFCIGSEMSGGVRNIFMKNNKIYDVDNALHIKSNTDRGGIVENIWFIDTYIEKCGSCVSLVTDYKGVDDHDYPSAYNNIFVKNIKCEKANNYGILIKGIKSNPIKNININNLVIEQAGEALEISHTEKKQFTDVIINGNKYDY